MLHEKAQTAGIRIAERKRARPSVIDCQKERLKQVFYNLLVNSIEAMGREAAS